MFDMSEIPSHSGIFKMHKLPVIYLYNSVCLFTLLFLFTVNTRTTVRIDTKCSVITKNDPESVLRRLKAPVLVLSEDIVTFPVFPSWPAAFFYLFPFPFRLLPRLLLTQSIFAKTSTACHIATDNSSLMKPSHLKRKCYCIDKFMYMQAYLASSIFICMHALHVITLKHCHMVA